MWELKTKTPCQTPMWCFWSPTGVLSATDLSLVLSKVWHVLGQNWKVQEPFFGNWLNKCKVTIWYRHPENSKKMYGLKHVISFSSRYFMSRMSESSWLGPAASCSSSLPDSISSFLMRPISSSGSSLTSSSSSLEVFTFLQAQQPSTGNRILDLH